MNLCYNKVTKERNLKTMTIIDDKREKVEVITFKDTKDGDFFEYDGCLFMATDVGNYMAYNFDTGKEEEMNSWQCIVQPLDVEITVLRNVEI